MGQENGWLDPAGSPRLPYQGARLAVHQRGEGGLQEGGGPASAPPPPRASGCGLLPVYLGGTKHCEKP